MYPRPVGTHVSVPFVLPRARASLALSVLGCLGFIILAYSVSGILRQIGRPCATCYLGAFGPPLEPYGHKINQHVDTAVPAPAGEPLWTAPGQSFRVDTDGPINMRHLRASDLTGSETADATPVWYRSDFVPGPGTDEPWTHVERDGLNASALMPSAVTLRIDGFMPHWRVAVQTDLERHFLQISASGMNATQPVAPLAPDTSAQIKDAPTLGGGFSLLGTDGALDTSRAGAPYRFAAAVTPAIQYFPVSGPGGAARYFWPDVGPSGSGAMAGIAFAPWDTPTSPVRFLNLRFAAQYAANKEFSGAVRGAGGNNTLVLSLWGALHF